MDVREKYVMQKVNRKEKSICPNCIHHNLCIAENNQPCFECNRFIDAHGVTVQEWISVDERLPDDNDRVIAFRPNEPETSAYKYCVMWGWSVKASLKHRGITHWCEMPQPPKGE